MHIFESVPDGTRVIDRVDYDVPGGAVVNRLFVEGELRRIFAYREKLIQFRDHGSGATHTAVAQSFP